MGYAGPPYPGMMPHPGMMPPGMMMPPPGAAADRLYGKAALAPASRSRTASANTFSMTVTILYCAGFRPPMMRPPPLRPTGQPVRLPQPGQGELRAQRFPASD